MPPNPSQPVRAMRAPRGVGIGPIRSNLLSMAESLAGVGYWRYRFADAALVWSDAVYQIYGLSRADFTPNGNAAISFFHPDDRPTAQSAFDRAIGQQTDMEFELRLVRA